MRSDDLDKIWKDQKEFNANFFPEAKSPEEKCSQTKEFVLCSISEMDELLRAIRWKIHRNVQPKLNPEHIRNEMTDIFKYFVSKCLVWGITPDDVVKDYWRKSAVCRQRYVEEYLSTVSNEDKVAVIDIDGVLADYKEGLLRWIDKNIEVKTPYTRPVRNSKEWNCDADSLGISESLWQAIKHRFRTEKGKLDIPEYPGATHFMKTLRAKGYKIIVLTSRPIDVYPNIYTETVEWLKARDMPFDFLWWANDKKEKILESNLRNVVSFAVDDDERHINMYDSIGVKSYWVKRYPTPKYERETYNQCVTVVGGLNNILFDLTSKGEL